MEERTETQSEGIEENPQADSGSVNVMFGSAGDVKGSQVTIRQGGVKSVNSEHLLVRQGGILRAQTEQLDIVGGAVGLAQTKEARMTASTVAAVLANGDVTLDQSMSRIVVANGNVTMDQSANLAVAARTVNADNSAVVFLLAQKVDGNVRTVFGPRESIIFGAAAGIVAGVMMLISRMVRGK